MKLVTHVMKTAVSRFRMNIVASLSRLNIDRERDVDWVFLMKFGSRCSLTYV